MNKKILIAWPAPFWWELINPAYEAIKLLPNHILNSEIIKLEIPTVFWKSFSILKSAIEREEPNIVICVGQAWWNHGISVERVAINIDDASIKDDE